MASPFSQAKEMGIKPKNPVMSLDKSFAEGIYPQLRNLFLGSESESSRATQKSRKDNRVFEKSFYAEKIPVLETSKIEEVVKQYLGTKIEDNNDSGKANPEVTASMTQEEVHRGSSHEDSIIKQAAEIIDSMEKKDSSIFGQNLNDRVEWKYRPDIPDPVTKLIDQVREKLQVPADSSCGVYAGLFFRTSKMMGPLPDKKTISRIVVNFGPRELYGLAEPYKGGKPIYVRQMILEPNTMLLMGPAGTSGFNIIVEGNPKYKVPGEMPIGVPGMRGLSKERFSIRPTKYERITVILDFYASKEMSLRLSNGASDNLDDPNPFLERLVGKIGPSILSSMTDKNAEEPEGNGSPLDEIPSSLKNMISGTGKAARRARRNKNRKDNKMKGLDLDKIIEERKERAQQNEDALFSAEGTLKYDSNTASEIIGEKESDEIDKFMEDVRNSKKRDQ